MTAPVPPDANGLREAVEALMCLCHETLCPVHNEAAGRTAEYDVPSLMEAIAAFLAASEAAPTAGERETPPCGICGGLGQVYDGPHIVWRPCWFCSPTTPPADNASEVEALAKAMRDAGIERGYVGADAIRYHWAERLLASDWLAARESAAATRARAEGAAEAAERIARAIEAERPEVGLHINVTSYREGRHDGMSAAASLARSDAAPHTGAQP